MNNNSHTWALVLAAGEGSRLRSLTTNANGLSVPKQFCSLQGGPSLMHDALQRAAAVVPHENICAVVAAQHQRWWEVALQRMAQRNVIVQPENRGTAHGILLPLLQIAARDPNAILLLLPADHHVRDEAALAAALHNASRLAAEHVDAIFLLGIEPDEADTELGYIVPAERKAQGFSRVLKFVEKPPAQQCNSLLESDALWNAFIVAASVSALLALYTERFTKTLAQMRDVLEKMPANAFGSTELTALYQTLSNADFSRDVLEGKEAALRVVAVPSCGWTDLGTPRRVGEALDKLPRERRLAVHTPHTISYLNLAQQHSRLRNARVQGVAS